MAVERLTDYTRRIWTALAADAPVPDMQVGDVIYYMDTSKCSIITGIPAPGSIDTADLPDIGGGGDPYEVARHFVAMNLQEYVDEGTTSIKNKAFMNISTLNKVIIHNVTGTFQQAFSGTAVRYVAFPKITSVTGYSGSDNQPLYGLDFTALSNLNGNAFNNDSNLNKLILRRTSAPVTLGNINVVNQTPFASGKTGGTLYVPAALIEAYQAATNWSVILAYSTNQILPIEGSIYETQYIDGTPIP